MTLKFNAEGEWKPMKSRNFTLKSLSKHQGISRALKASPSMLNSKTNPISFKARIHSLPLTHHSTGTVVTVSDSVPCFRKLICTTSRGYWHKQTALPRTIGLKVMQIQSTSHRLHTVISSCGVVSTSCCVDGNLDRALCEALHCLSCAS